MKQSTKQPSSQNGMTLNGNLGCSFCQGHLNLFILIYTAFDKSR